MLMRRHATPPDRSLNSVVSTVLGHAFGVTHSRCQRPRINAGMAISSTSIGNAIGATNFLSSRWKDTRNCFWITCNIQVEGIRCLASNNLYIVQISAIRLYNVIYVYITISSRKLKIHTIVLINRYQKMARRLAKIFLRVCYRLLSIKVFTYDVAIMNETTIDTVHRDRSSKLTVKGFEWITKPLNLLFLSLLFSSIPYNYTN